MSRGHRQKIKVLVVSHRFRQPIVRHGVGAVIVLSLFLLLVLAQPRSVTASSYSDYEARIAFTEYLSASIDTLFRYIRVEADSSRVQDSAGSGAPSEQVERLRSILQKAAEDLILYLYWTRNCSMCENYSAGDCERFSEVVLRFSRTQMVIDTLTSQLRHSVPAYDRLPKYVWSIKKNLELFETTECSH